MMNFGNKIYIAGYRGMVGSAIERNLRTKGFENIITRTFTELDLRNQKSDETFFETEQPEYVFLAAPKVGGIQANNTYRADFLCDNLMIEANIIHEACRQKTKKLLFYPVVFTPNLRHNH